MSWIRPFLKSEKQTQRVDEGRNNQTDHEHGEQATDRLRDSELAQEQKA
jgi:hypothetical protein